MGQLEDEVRELILDSSRSIAAFARDIGIPEHTLYSVLNNGLAGASMSTVLPIVKALGISPYGILEGRIISQSNDRLSVAVPLFGSISAGAPAEPDSADDTFPIPSSLHDKYPDAFMLRVDGTSVNRVIPDGYYALVNPCSTVDTSGQLYAVAVDDTLATVKRVRVLNNGIALEPDSDDPTYRPLVFDYADSGSSVSVIGRVVWFCPPFEWGQEA